MAHLTTEEVQKFARGRIEIDDKDKGCFYTGEPGNLIVVAKEGDATLKVRLVWMAEAIGYPPNVHTRWGRCGILEYEVNLELYRIAKPSGGCLILDSWMNVPTVTLHLPDCDNLKLQFADTEELTPTTAQ